VRITEQVVKVCRRGDDAALSKLEHTLSALLRGVQAVRNDAGLTKIAGAFQESRRAEKHIA
jgi:hypothetical protein